MLLKFSIPLDWQLSKNRKFIGRTKKVLNPFYVDAKRLISHQVAVYLFNNRGCFVKDKVWVKIKVYKTLKGDCHNLIEGILDAIKTEIKVDDNYFAVVCDYEISKDKRVDIEIYQEEVAEGLTFAKKRKTNVKS